MRSIRRALPIVIVAVIALILVVLSGTACEMVYETDDGAEGNTVTKITPLQRLINLEKGQDKLQSDITAQGTTQTSTLTTFRKDLDSISARIAQLENAGVDTTLLEAIQASLATMELNIEVLQLSASRIEARLELIEVELNMSVPQPPE